MADPAHDPSSTSLTHTEAASGQDWRDDPPRGSSAGSLRIRYTAALMVVAALATIGQILIQQSLSERNKEMERLALFQELGWQSPRLFRLAQLLAHPGLDGHRRQQTDTEFRYVARSWKQAREGLDLSHVAVDAGSFTSQIRQVNDQLDRDAEAIVRAIELIEDRIETASASGLPPMSLDSEPLEILSQRQPKFQMAIAQLASAYRQELESQTKRLQLIELLLYAILVFALILEGCFIFSPAIARARRTIRQLEQTRSDLDRKNLELRGALTRADEATRAKDLFLANMSHEIRTPLNAVLGMTSLLNETTLNDYQRECLQTISTSGATLLSLIDDLLDLSKIEADRLDLEEAAFNVRQVLEEAIEMVAEPAGRKNLELVLHVNRGMPEVVQGDSTRFRQVLLNLLSNAIKFTQRGEILVEAEAQPIGSARHEDNGASTGRPGLQYRIDVAVRDTGIGIPDTRLDKLFEPFVQADTSTTRLYGGTGLGLAICKRLVERMGGQIGVESQEGLGSCFQFHVVLTESEPDDSSSHVIPALDTHRLRVLVVDDNLSARLALRGLLESWGIACQLAASAREAMSLIHQGPIDAEKLRSTTKASTPAPVQAGPTGAWSLTIIDMHLDADQDGLGLARAIRQMPAYAELPIVLLDAPGRPQRDSTTKMARSRRLIKPVRSHLLARTLASLTHNRLEVTADSTIDDPVSRLIDGSLGERHPLRILLAEDAPANQKVLLFILRRIGYTQVDIAQNGQEAVDMIRRRSYDLILMDMQMPVLDGLEATRQICHEYREDRRPWIVALTANAFAEDRQRCLDAGMDDYLSKPVKPESLARALARCPRFGLRDHPIFR